MNPNEQVDPEMAAMLDVLRSVTPRNIEDGKYGRAAFLREAADVAEAVSKSKKRRPNGWMYTLQSIFTIPRKEHSPMFSSLATIMIIVSLVLGGSGATVVAAQNSQPDQALYSLKVLSEDVRLGLASDLQTEYQLTLEFANRRAEEIQSMLLAGNIPPEAVQARYQNQVEQAIQFALSLPNGQALQALEQIKVRLQTQQQALHQVKMSDSPNAIPFLTQTQQMLQERLQWLDEGLIDPQKLRDQLRQRTQQRQQDQQTPGTPAAKFTEVMPGTGGGNPWTTGTPTPGSGYGPGPGTGDCITCTPVGNGESHNPWTTGTPTPGSGYGPGPGPDSTRTCTPGSGGGSGPQSTQPVNNQPTQAGPQPTQQQKNQPTQSGPQPTMESQPTQGAQSTPSGPGPQPTGMPGGPGGKH